eukprot:801249-Pyramimonas_sp.AAC.1
MASGAGAVDEAPDPAPHEEAARGQIVRIARARRWFQHPEGAAREQTLMISLARRWLQPPNGERPK